jgi:predicted DNA-binding protein
MVTLRLKPADEKRLGKYARKAGHTKASLARAVIEEKLEELEDVTVAVARLKKPARTYSAEEVKRELGRPL